MQYYKTGLLIHTKTEFYHTELVFQKLNVVFYYLLNITKIKNVYLHSCFRFHFLLHTQPVAVGSTNLPLKIFSAPVVQLTVFLIKKAPQDVTVRMGITGRHLIHRMLPAQVSS